VRRKCYPPLRLQIHYPSKWAPQFLDILKIVDLKKIKKV
jgi:hypothetical protein